MYSPLQFSTARFQWEKTYKSQASSLEIPLPLTMRFLVGPFYFVHVLYELKWPRLCICLYISCTRLTIKLDKKENSVDLKIPFYPIVFSAHTGRFGYPFVRPTTISQRRQPSNHIYGGRMFSVQDAIQQNRALTIHTQYMSNHHFTLCAMISFLELVRARREKHIFGVTSGAEQGASQC